MTDAQKQLWKKLIRQIINDIVINVLKFKITRLDKSIDKVQEKQEELSEQQRRTYELLYIDYKSTDWALAQMFDGKYIELKCDKKQELKDDFEFKNKSKGD